MIGKKRRETPAIPMYMEPTDHKLQKIGRLGGGTYGRVYEAIQATDIYAVKSNHVSKDLKGTIACVRELDILNLICNHPYCIKLYDICLDVPFKDGSMSPIDDKYIPDKMYFILEKGTCDGDDYIRRRKPLVNEKKIFMLHLLLAVEFVHSRGIYHCDIKPANIICMLNSKGELDQAKLSDFGMSQHWTSQVLSLSGIVTLWYRAPEISLHKDYGLAIDIWSLGCIFFELFSPDNNRFIEPEHDSQLINMVIGKLPVSGENYHLAKQIHGVKITKTYNNLQANLKTLEQQLGYTHSQISQFDSSLLAGKPNSGTFSQFIDLLNHMLVVDPENRWTAAQCLNHPFFASHRGFIDENRNQFGIDQSGSWMAKPEPVFMYRSDHNRDNGMKWFSLIYSNRNTEPINYWYTHRMFFHALEMFDRYLLTLPENLVVSESDIVIWINTVLFISCKYFRMNDDVGLCHFMIGVDPAEYEIYKNRVYQFEEYLIRDVFQYTLYRDTIYEIADEYLSDIMIYNLLKCLINHQFPSGVSLLTFWEVCAKYLHHTETDK